MRQTPPATKSYRYADAGHLPVKRSGRRCTWGGCVSRHRRIPGVSVTGQPNRVYQGGFETEEAAWDAALSQKSEVDRI